MSKGIIIVDDIPVICAECNLATVTQNGKYLRCEAKNKVIYNAKPDWCPIKSMPERKALTGDVSNPEKLRNLQDVIDYKVMSFTEAVKALGWIMNGNNGEAVTVECNCGKSDIEYSGFVGTENICCRGCGKEMIYLFSALPVGSYACTVLDPSDYRIERDDDGNPRYWIAHDGEGGILNIRER